MAFLPKEWKKRFVFIEAKRWEQDWFFFIVMSDFLFTWQDFQSPSLTWATAVLMRIKWNNRNNENEMTTFKYGEKYAGNYLMRISKIRVYEKIRIKKREISLMWEIF